MLTPQEQVATLAAFGAVPAAAALRSAAIGALLAGEDALACAGVELACIAALAGDPELGKVPLEDLVLLIGASVIAGAYPGKQVQAKEN
jgi:hypothetical protein